MVSFLVEPAAPGADDKRVHKYPYMACEVTRFLFCFLKLGVSGLCLVTGLGLDGGASRPSIQPSVGRRLPNHPTNPAPPPQHPPNHHQTTKRPTCQVICCEVDHILDTLVAMHDGQAVARLFALLDAEGEIDDRLSGYFEKIVFVLLKRKCLQVGAWVGALIRSPAFDARGPTHHHHHHHRPPSSVLCLCLTDPLIPTHPPTSSWRTSTPAASPSSASSCGT